MNIFSYEFVLVLPSRRIATDSLGIESSSGDDGSLVVAGGSRERGERGGRRRERERGAGDAASAGEGNAFGGRDRTVGFGGGAYVPERVSVPPLAEVTREA